MQLKVRLWRWRRYDSRWKRVSYARTVGFRCGSGRWWRDCLRGRWRDGGWRYSRGGIAHLFELVNARGESGDLRPERVQFVLGVGHPAYTIASATWRKGLEVGGMPRRKGWLLTGPQQGLERRGGIAK